MVSCFQCASTTKKKNNNCQVLKCCHVLTLVFSAVSLCVLCPCFVLDDTNTEEETERQRQVGRGVKVAIWQYQQSSEVQSEVLSSLQDCVCVCVCVC